VKLLAAKQAQRERNGAAREEGKKEMWELGKWVFIEFWKL